MAPKSVAALVLLAAMIAGLAPPLQAQLDQKKVDIFLSLVDHMFCSGDDAMTSCARQLVASEGARTPPDCCGDLLKAITSSEGPGCACDLESLAASIVGVDVDRRCQAASNGGVAGGPSLKKFCMGN